MYRACCVVLVSALALAWAVELQPIPEAPVQAERLKALRTIYASEYSQRDDEARASFARTLLNQGKTAADDPAAQYVFYREALEQAIKAGEVDTGRMAVEEIAKIFAIDRPSELLRMYNGVAGNLTTLDQARMLVDDQLAIADRAIAVDDYALATRAATQADGVARRVKDASLPLRTKHTMERVRELSAQYAALGDLTDVLGQMTPEGHGKYGRFLALVKQDWTAALPHLVQGTDIDLKPLAIADAAAETPEAKVAAADAWWEWGKKQKAVVKTAVSLRAFSLYRSVQLDLTGLARAKVDKRIEEAIKLLGASASAANWPPGAVLILTCDGAILDASPQRQQIRISGAAPETGPWGTALCFAGDQDVVTVANSPSLQTNGSMTLAMWARPTALASRQNLWDKCYGGEGTWTLEPGGDVTFFCGKSGKEQDGTYGRATMDDDMVVNEWAHLVVIRDAATKTLIWYKNGKEVERGQDAFTPTALSTADVRIGNGYAGPFAGLIDDIGLWPRVLTEKEIAALYAATVAGRK